jgi:CopG family nickel-responsive transcriptional regulator
MVSIQPAYDMGCLAAEMILAKGRASHIREIADLLRQQKGVLHATLSMSSTGKRLV